MEKGGRFRSKEDRLFGKESPFEIRWGPNGRYLVTSQAFRKGSVLWTEEPFASLQSLPNVSQLEACHRCFRCVGTFESQMSKALGEPMPALLHEDGREYELLSSPTLSCEWGCGVRYCSSKCLEQDKKTGHALLCVGLLTEDTHPLLELKRFAIKHNEIYLVAAKMVARVLMAHALGENKNRDSLDEAIWPLSLLMRMPWSECVVYTKDMSPEERADAQLVEYASRLSASELRQQSDEVHSLLRKAMLSSDVVKRVPGLSEVVAPLMDLMDSTFFHELIGLCEINCSAVSFFGCASHVLRDSKIDAERRFQAQKFLWEALVEEDDPAPLELTRSSVLELCDVLPYFDGLAIFDKISVMQHSCVPNVINKFGEDFTAEVTALRDIEVGEELVHSYIECEADYARRSRILQLWGFSNGCECSACRQKQDLEPKESSDEDDDEDDDDEHEDEHDCEDHGHSHSH